MFRVSERRTPPGQLIALRRDGKRVLVHAKYHAPPHLQHAPCIIFEAGANSWSPVWDKVVTRVSQYARVFVYDRPGFGFSPGVVGLPRTPRAAANDLRNLLHTLGVSPPYVLVAHSLGAIYTNELAAGLTQGVDGICGVVYIDAASPESLRLLTTVVPTAVPPVWLARVLGALGVLRALAPVVLRPYVTAFKGNLARQARATWARGDWLLAYTGEWAAAIQALDRPPGDPEGIWSPPGWLGSLPIAVIVPDVYDRTEGKAFVGALQRAVECYSTDAISVSVNDCGHFVQLERPDIVTDTIEAVIQRAKAKGVLESHKDVSSDKISGLGCSEYHQHS